MKIDLPLIIIPFKGIISFQLNDKQSVVSADIISSIKQFEDQWRGPILAYCSRIESMIDIKIADVSSYIFNTNKKKTDILLNVFISKPCILLGKKRTIIVELCRLLNEMQKECINIKKLQLALKNFIEIRNTFAHARIQPKARNNIIKLTIITAGNKAINIDKVYANSIEKKLQATIDMLNNIEILNAKS